MPELITHNKVFLESVNYLGKKKGRTTVTRSLEALFGNADFLKAGIFGALGPDLFDYMPGRDDNPLFRSDLSWLLHNGGAAKFISAMAGNLLSQDDFNNEWSSAQRALAYGFISHIVCDSLFYPFVFFWSGFTGPGSGKKEIQRHQEQHLLFEYNMDLYFTYHHTRDKHVFDPESMLPLKRNGEHRILEPAVKSLILETVREVYPAQYGRMIWREHKTGHASGSLGKLDLVPYALPWIYRLKRSRNRSLTGVLDRLRRSIFFYSDRVVRYPDPRRINRHVLNLHRERWFYPAGGRGLHYESAEDLFRMSVERTVEIWEKMESRFYRKEKDLSDVMKMLRANPLTGETDKGYTDLRIAEPVRLRF